MLSTETQTEEDQAAVKYLQRALEDDLETLNIARRANMALSSLFNDGRSDKVDLQIVNQRIERFNRILKAYDAGTLEPGQLHSMLKKVDNDDYVVDVERFNGFLSNHEQQRLYDARLGRFVSNPFPKR